VKKISSHCSTLIFILLNDWAIKLFIFFSGEIFQLALMAAEPNVRAPPIIKQKGILRNNNIYGCTLFVRLAEATILIITAEQPRAKNRMPTFCKPQTTIINGSIYFALLILHNNGLRVFVRHDISRRQSDVLIYTTRFIDKNWAFIMAGF